MGCPVLTDLCLVRMTYGNSARFRERPYDLHLPRSEDAPPSSHAWCFDRALDRSDSRIAERRALGGVFAQRGATPLARKVHLPEAVDLFRIRN